MAFGEQSCVFSRNAAVCHVLGSVNSLADTSVQSATLAFRITGAHKGRLELKMKDQPQFEARIGNSKADTVVGCHPNGEVKVGMVLRPLDIEYAPALVDLVVTAPLNRSLHEGKRYPLPGINFDAN
jgi:hypothetical protein